jgi:hypothetical protein
MTVAPFPFEIFIDDDRYSVPTLRLVSATDEAEARRVAADMLATNGHYRGIEVCREGRRLIGLGSYAQDVRGLRPAPAVRAVNCAAEDRYL